MLEIIRRKEGELSQKQELRHDKTQVSYNDFGHLCIRGFGEVMVGRKCKINASETICANNSMKCIECADYQKETEYPEEHLIVFDAKTSRQIIEFVSKLFRHGNSDLPY